LKKTNLIHLIKRAEKTGETYSDVLYSEKIEKHFKVSVFQTDPGLVSCLFFDITEYITSDDSEMYKYISSITSDGFRYINNRTGFCLASSKWHELFGGRNKSEDEFSEKIHPDFRNLFCRNMAKTMEMREKSFHMEYRLADEETWVEHSATFKYSSEGVCVEEVHYYKDITELKQKQLELEYMAYFDMKTKTYNRKYL
jgi:hypothetical protein